MEPQLALVLDATRPMLDPESLCDAEERAVARALQWGRARARQIPEIATHSGLSGRRVQDIIAHLIDVHGWPIGTAMAEPFGAYLIDSAAELEQTVALLRTRGISNLARVAALKRISLARYLSIVQTEINLERKV